MPSDPSRKSAGKQVQDMSKLEASRISIQAMKFYGYHGLLPEEHAQGQPYFVDVDMYLSLLDAALADDLAKSIDYGAVYGLAKSAVELSRRNLIESVAYDIADKVMEAYKPERVTVRVRKPKPPVGGCADFAEAEITLVAS
jgi:dihydroneopterin aldolase